MAYEMVMPYHLHMPSYFLETFTEYPGLGIRIRPFNDESGSQVFYVFLTDKQPHSNSTASRKTIGSIIARWFQQRWLRNQYIPDIEMIRDFLQQDKSFRYTSASFSEKQHTITSPS